MALQSTSEVLTNQNLNQNTDRNDKVLLGNKYIIWADILGHFRHALLKVCSFCCLVSQSMEIVNRLNLFDQFQGCIFNITPKQNMSSTSISDLYDFHVLRLIFFLIGRFHLSFLLNRTTRFVYIGHAFFLSLNLFIFFLLKFYKLFLDAFMCSLRLY